jgi:hypothetical protein
MTEDTSYSYSKGHQNHLTGEQVTALAKFKALAQDNQCYTPATETSSASHDDETLLRFLRARKFVPADALQQFKTTAEWRKNEDIVHWYTTIDIEDYEATRLLVSSKVASPVQRLQC